MLGGAPRRQRVVSFSVWLGRTAGGETGGRGEEREGGRGKEVARPLRYDTAMPGREGTGEGRREEGAACSGEERRGLDGSHYLYFPRGSPSPQVVGTRTVLLVGKGRSMSERSTVKKTFKWFNMAPRPWETSWQAEVP